MVVTWSAAGIAYLTHPQAWQDVRIVQPEKGLDVFLYILGMNALLIALIVIGNIFIRFGSVTPGLAILLWQAISIGWIAGTNSFLDPFPSFAEANRAFLYVGLWETSAYVVFCAVTLAKSLFVADTFPAKEWSQTHSTKELHFTKAEWAAIGIGVLFLVGAAYVEAFIHY